MRPCTDPAMVEQGVIGARGLGGGGGFSRSSTPRSWKMSLRSRTSTQ